MSVDEPTLVGELIKSALPLDEQARLLFLCDDIGKEDLLTWAESAVSRADTSLPWIFELYTLNSRRREDYCSFFREKAPQSGTRSLDQDLLLCARAVCDGNIRIESLIGVFDRLSVDEWKGRRALEYRDEFGRLMDILRTKYEDDCLMLMWNEIKQILIDIKRR